MRARLARLMKAHTDLKLDHTNLLSTHHSLGQDFDTLTTRKEELQVGLDEALNVLQDTQSELEATQAALEAANKAGSELQTAFNTSQSQHDLELQDARGTVKELQRDIQDMTDSKRGLEVTVQSLSASLEGIRALREAGEGDLKELQKRLMSTSLELSKEQQKHQQVSLRTKDMILSVGDTSQAACIPTCYLFLYAAAESLRVHS